MQKQTAKFQSILKIKTLFLKRMTGLKQNIICYTSEQRTGYEILCSENILGLDGHIFMRGAINFPKMHHSEHAFPRKKFLKKFPNTFCFSE